MKERFCPNSQMDMVHMNIAEMRQGKNEQIETFIARFEEKARMLSDIPDSIMVMHFRNGVHQDIRRDLMLRSLKHPSEAYERARLFVMASRTPRNEMFAMESRFVQNESWKGQADSIMEPQRVDVPPKVEIVRPTETGLLELPKEQLMHCFEALMKEYQATRSERRRPQTTQRPYASLRNFSCWNCGMDGHVARNCRRPSTSSARPPYERICSHCRGDHLSENCRVNAGPHIRWMCMSPKVTDWISLGPEVSLEAHVPRRKAKRHKTQVIVDTGSNVSVMSKKLLDIIFTGTEPADLVPVETVYASGLGQEKIPCSLLAMEIPLILGDYALKHKFCVMDGGPDLLLGTDFCSYHGVVVDFANETVILGCNPKQGMTEMPAKPHEGWSFRTWSGPSDQASSDPLEDSSAEATGYSGDNESNSDETLIIVRSDTELSDDGQIAQSQALGSEVVPDLSEGDEDSPLADDSMTSADEQAAAGHKEE